MKRVKEFKDYEQDSRTAVEQLNDHLQNYPDTEIIGYTVNVFENLANKERTYILIQYEVENK
ncbi:hypothetical protein PQ701_04290 [Staphylococcus coagulans]|uniref:hypothetical protein n=1 Tax=Staphylococcus coagulans TaxID=74706 RepID=UPI002928A3D7|nr:hypothetical protein [Staphylococcus coagulans]MDU9304441.1 hypothetical protein [Staphylococcus coagulans]